MDLDEFGDSIAQRTQAEDALKIDPNDSKAHYNLAGALNAQGEYAKALEHIERSLSIDGRPYQKYWALSLEAEIYHNMSSSRAIDIRKKVMEEGRISGVYERQSGLEDCDATFLIEELIGFKEMDEARMTFLQLEHLLNDPGYIAETRKELGLWEVI